MGIINFEDPQLQADRAFVPDHMRDPIENYLLRGWSPGGFMTAILAGDLFRAATIADTANRETMYYITRWVMFNAPEDSWGSYEKVADWIRDKDGKRTDYRDVLERQHVWKVLST